MDVIEKHMKRQGKNIHANTGRKFFLVYVSYLFVQLRRLVSFENQEVRSKKRKKRSDDNNDDFDKKDEEQKNDSDNEEEEVEEDVDEEEEEKEASAGSKFAAEMAWEEEEVEDGKPNERGC